MSDMKLLVDMMSEMRETSMAQQIELTRLNTMISIEIPSIKEQIKAFKIGNMQENISSLESRVKDFTESMETMNESIKAMKPVIQFFTFVKWISIGAVAILGWVGTNASGLWQFIEKWYQR